MALRKASNVRVEQGGIIFIHYKFWVTAKDYFEIEKKDYQILESDLESFGAAGVGVKKGRVLWWTNDGYYWTEEGLSAEEVGLLVWERKQKERAKFDRLRKLRNAETVILTKNRKSIPSEIKLAVWKRDGEQCVQCGSQQELQFDHIIPVAKGGADTLENLQILCAPCNRRKRDSIA